MASVALSIRQPTLNPTRKEIATRKRQEFPVQQASLGTAVGLGSTSARATMTLPVM
ncbi:hypothetical protein PC115_g20872 [Phytophthora cactorum]|nr:hypothetical protein PC115_g20872 [Phytophthora cactorum]KAG2901637.1 hypothetical protein PC117_g21671 [Phytophthora cactorum]KAG2990914.1 hypothetical protein PC120_g22822 [Phytophthora cactorum]KAG3012964.1 hypothetical protein PC121_g25207 [Phytophthora cactorum]